MEILGFLKVETSIFILPLFAYGSLLLLISVYILFYWRIYVHMKWISHDNTDMINP